MVAMTVSLASQRRNLNSAFSDQLALLIPEKMLDKGCGIRNPSPRPFFQPRRLELNGPGL